MTERSSQMPRGAAHDHHRRELLREAATMGLYVAICLLAALAVSGNAAFDHRRTALAVIWGTTLGLSLAHWFAFRLSARLVASGAVRSVDGELAAAQLAGSAVVAVLATVPLLVVNGIDAQYDAASWVLAGVIAVIGFLVARVGGASVLRSVLYAGATTTVAAAIVVIKNMLGH